ncbi:hypothetical protein IWX85_001084 [Polaromonas sp. CG_9.11]|nr:hypothetical protein [Polaromonas sp. CG_9.11]
MRDEEHFAFSFKGNAAIYRYGDATACLAFGLRMTEQ